MFIYFNSHCDRIWEWSSWEVFQFTGEHKCSVLIIKLVPLLKRNFSPHLGKKSANSWPSVIHKESPQHKSAILHLRPALSRINACCFSRREFCYDSTNQPSHLPSYYLYNVLDWCSASKKWLRALFPGCQSKEAILGLPRTDMHWWAQQAPWLLARFFYCQSRFLGFLCLPHYASLRKPTASGERRYDKHLHWQQGIEELS